MSADVLIPSGRGGLLIDIKGDLADYCVDDGCQCGIEMFAEDPSSVVATPYRWYPGLPVVRFGGGQ